MGLYFFCNVLIGEGKHCKLLSATKNALPRMGLEMKMKMKMKKNELLLFLYLAPFSFLVGITCGSNSFYLNHFGAVGDGITNDTEPFLSMWEAGCSTTGDVKLFVPKKEYLIGPIQFKGPCKAQSIFFNMQGYLKATTNLKDYGDDWLQFGWVNSLTLVGGGTFDGQGAASWRYNTCPKIQNCKILPVSLKFVHCTNTVLRSLTSLNSKFFHIGMVGCNNFQASNLKIFAPSNSPNTDGIHIERCSDVNINSSIIRTGDDCISLGHGNFQITVSGITCGPGHGISVGSLGRYPYEKDVQALVIRDSVLTDTTNGVRIKTWADSPGSINAYNMTFENIVMNNVANPIIIDQAYCPYEYCSSKVPSSVKLSNISFRNIRGTSTTSVAVTIKCSKGFPCQNIHLQDVHLDVTGGLPGISDCKNAQVRYSGTQIPPPCVI